LLGLQTLVVGNLLQIALSP